MSFSSDFLTALGTWQCGWREDKGTRERITQSLLNVIETESLPDTVRSVDGECWRKRFLVANNPQNGGDMVPLILDGQIQEGVASWTLEREVAYNFKGLLQLDCQGRIAIGSQAAVFRRTPAQNEVILNISALWQSPGFEDAVQEFVSRTSEGSNEELKKAASGLRNFGPQANWQAEVILNAPLCRNEVEAIVGRSSSFEDLCELAGRSTDDEKEWFSKQLVAAGMNPEEAQWLIGDRIQAALQRAEDIFLKKHQISRDGHPDC